MGAKVFVTMSDGVGTRRAGRISHAHKDGTYSVTFEDADSRSDSSSLPTREKHICRSRIEAVAPETMKQVSNKTDDDDQEEWTTIAGTGQTNDITEEQKQRKVLDNLRLLDRMEAADRKSQEKSIAVRQKPLQKQTAANARLYASSKGEKGEWYTLYKGIYRISEELP